MVAVIVANPTPTDNEGGNYIANGKQIEINQFKKNVWSF